MRKFSVETIKTIITNRIETNKFMISLYSHR